MGLANVIWNKAYHMSVLRREDLPYLESQKVHARIERTRNSLQTFDSRL